MTAVNRYYSSTAVDTTLTGNITSGAASMTVAATTGFPLSYPYTLVIDPGLVTQELVEVTNASGTTLTVTRHVDGTAASAHSAGAVVQHDVSARDYTEPQQHIAASSAVHGLAGTVVGTTDTQTLTNKTIDGSANTITNVPKASVAGAPTGAFVGTTDTQTLTNKTLQSPTVNSPVSSNGIFTDPTINSGSLDLATTWDGVAGDTFAGAWSTFAPVFTGSGSNPTVSNLGSVVRQIGKTMFLHVAVQFTAVGSGSYTLTLPNGKTLKHATRVLGIHGNNTSVGYIELLQWLGSASGSTLQLQNSSGPITSGSVTANDQFFLDAVIEVA